MDIVMIMEATNENVEGPHLKLLTVQNKLNIAIRVFKRCVYERSIQRSKNDADCIMYTIRR